MLEIHGLSKSFGGVAAVQDVSFSVRRGLVHSLIGPNGAGKTTLFNLITGVYQPNAGCIMLEGSDVSGASPDRLAARGVSRTFQNLQVCMNMTACENVMLGAHLRTCGSLLAGMLGLTRKRDRMLREEAEGLMEYVGVGDYIRAHTTQLSFGVLKRLEIARALASKPRLLLLDEPAAGLNDTETAQVGELIARVAAGGTTILLVEHNMKMVMRISHQLVVLNYGKKLAEGGVDEIRNNPQVIAAYLGVEASR